ncbi:ATP-binding protein [Streptomyces corynorhini]|uniref:ATP-binding protein n=1 Tax=Streptomyces corynorhini TaxID=2282652 RepID=A0A370BEF5_9ACTN|nr:ATP-binding protein [Streptomyces corynorhini]RDG38203.1 ATP-binding protein [Streptomyces corynorhini]
MTTVTTTAPPTPPPPQHGETYRLALPHTPTAPRIARSFVSSLLTVSDHDALVDDARICVSEVVTNAHRHTRTPLIRVAVIVGISQVTVAVTDDRPWLLPVPTATARARGSAVDGVEVGPGQGGFEDGRGIALVASLAHAWGTTIYASDPTGRKAIWFTRESPG